MGFLQIIKGKRKIDQNLFDWLFKVEKEERKYPAHGPGQYFRVICGDYINKYILGKCQLF